MAGIETAALANDVCGAPIPWTLICPWLYMDGKLFHFKLLKANNNTPLIDICDGQVSLLCMFFLFKRFMSICNSFSLWARIIFLLRTSIIHECLITPNRCQRLCIDWLHIGSVPVYDLCYSFHSNSLRLIFYFFFKVHFTSYQTVFFFFFVVALSISVVPIVSVPIIKAIHFLIPSFSIFFQAKYGTLIALFPYLFSTFLMLLMHLFLGIPLTL